MKRRVVILPLQDQTNYKNDTWRAGYAAAHLAPGSTGTVISIDPQRRARTGLPEPTQMVALNETTVSGHTERHTVDVYTSSYRWRARILRKHPLPCQHSLAVYNTDTGALLKQVSGRNLSFCLAKKGR